MNIFSSLIYLACFKGLLKKKIADFSPRSNLRAFGTICKHLEPPGDHPGGAPKIGLLNLGIILGGDPPGVTPPRGPPGDPKGPPGEPQEIPSQILDHPGIVEGVPRDSSVFLRDSWGVPGDFLKVSRRFYIRKHNQNLSKFDPIRHQNQAKSMEIQGNSSNGSGCDGP